MALYLVATPIGNPDDISLRALKTLEAAEILIGEEAKEAKSLLRRYQLPDKKLYLLNEHSESEDIKELADLCEKHEVALITDCGTPGFCDPGALLVAECRKRKVKVTSLPGASSIMCILSMSGSNLRDFDFVGFLPAKKELRIQAFKKLQKQQKAFICMDTPYRFKKFLEECAQYFPEQKVLVGIDLTQETEKYIEAKAKDLKSYHLPEKAEFILIVYPRQ